MSHRVHPKAFRLQETSNWDSRWLSKKDFAGNLREDFIIREYLTGKLKEAWVQNIEIERFAGKTNVIVSTARPGLIIGRGGQGVEELKKGLQRAILKDLLKRRASSKPREVRRELRIEIREIKDLWANANLVAQAIAQQMEKRMPFRRVLKQTLSKVIANKEIKGARVEVAGRLDGVEIARTEWLKSGRLPRQTLRADIDYGTSEALCTYGKIGVKVWLYKGERTSS